jgi:hypothetical protein
MAKNDKKAKNKTSGYAAAKKPAKMLNKDPKSKKTLANQKKAIIYFYGAYGLFYVIAMLYRSFLPVVEIPFYIAETNQSINYEIQLAEIFDVLLVGIIFSINVNRAYFYLQDNLGVRKKRYTVPLLVSIIILNFGVIVHMVANQLHEIIHDDVFTAGSNLELLQQGLYFWDETASHILSAAGLFMLMLLLVFVEAADKSHVESNNYLLNFICLLVGFGLAFGLIEGQCAAIFFFVSIAYLLVIFVIIGLTKKTWKDKPFMAATTMVLVGYIIFTLIYVYVTGMKDVYPFIMQITETEYNPF